MAYITFQPSDYFNTKLFTGDGSSNRGITGVGFQPDLVWLKTRTSRANSHVWIDAVRGTNRLRSDSNAAEASVSGEFISFDSDGFTVTGGGANELNYNSVDYATWNWKANGQGSSNTDGSINTTYTSVNTTAGFSISQYTGTGSAATIGHGLGAVPSVILCKNLDASANWLMYHSTQGATKYMVFNDTDAVAVSGGSAWNGTSPTSSVFSVGSGTTVNGSGNDMIAYCFAEKKGYSKFGAYTGNGNVNGAFVYTGFKPAVLIVKTYTTNGGWQIYDSKRNTGNPTSKFLVPSSNAVETSGSNDIDFLSNGFKTRTTANPGTTDSFIYMAFAAEPLVSSNNIPATAR